MRAHETAEKYTPRNNDVVTKTHLETYYSNIKNSTKCKSRRDIY